MVTLMLGQEFGVAARGDASPVAIVQQELQAAGYRGLRGVTSHLSDGVLVLKGCVSSFYQKQIAQTIARRHLSPGSLIDNRIRVVRHSDEIETATGTCRADQQSSCLTSLQKPQAEIAASPLPSGVPA